MLAWVRTPALSIRYHRLYLATKGNKYKTKKQLMEAVHKMKAEKTAEKTLEDLASQKKARAKTERARKEAKAAESSLQSAE
jgi:large subunit ribosomal protein L19e